MIQHKIGFRTWDYSQRVKFRYSLKKNITKTKLHLKK